MENLQKECEIFFSGVCYAFCLVKKFRPKASNAEIIRYTLDGLICGYIEYDGYVSQPVHFVNYITDQDELYVDVKKVDYKKEELTEDSNIVMWQYKGNTHFVIMNKEGEVIWDPSGNSNAVKYGIPVSIRKFITR